MADVKVTDMTAATSVNSADVLYCVQNNTDRRLSVSTLMSSFPNTPMRLSGILILAGKQTIHNVGIVNATQTTTILTNDVGTSNGLSISDGSIDGQIKFVIHTSGTGATTLSGLNISSSLLFNKPGHSAQMIWIGNRWWVVGGTAIGASSISDVDGGVA